MPTPIVTKHYSGTATSDSEYYTQDRVKTITEIKPDDGGPVVIASSYGRLVSAGERVTYTVTTGPVGEIITLD
jgi:hypothetical protein